MREKKRWLFQPGEQLSAVPLTEETRGRAAFTERVWEGDKGWVNSQHLLSATHVFGPGGVSDLDATAMILTFIANPFRSATREAPEKLVLGTVSVLVPRRWTLDNGIFNSRLAT